MTPRIPPSLPGEIRNHDLRDANLVPPVGRDEGLSPAPSNLTLSRVGESSSLLFLPIPSTNRVSRDLFRELLFSHDFHTRHRALQHHHPIPRWRVVPRRLRPRPGRAGLAQRSPPYGVRNRAGTPRPSRAVRNDAPAPRILRRQTPFVRRRTR